MQQEQGVLDNISTGIIALDAQLCVLAMNASGQALLELSESRYLGSHARQLLLQPEHLLQSLQQVLRERSPLSQRGMSLILLGGQEIHVDMMITPVGENNGDIAMLVEIQPVDRLLKISREEGLVHSQETTRAVIRGLAHEIKNPLGGVRGAAQLLDRELPDKSLTEYTQVIIREADRLRDLVDRLLGPNQQLKLHQLNIHEVLEHVCNLITAESSNQVTICRDYDPSLPEFAADRAQMVQALLNIVRNALQAAESPQQCQITLRTRPQRQLTVGSVRHRLGCRVEIIDNGPGIPEDMLHAVFAPMVTGRADGTGLGLSIAQSVISRHGGLLECESSPGLTKFIIQLPMESENAETG